MKTEVVEFLKWFLPLLVSSGVLGGAVALFKKTWGRVSTFQEGMQALLRAQMISEYNKAKERGYAPIYAKQNFENMWDKYHNLGANGVMDSIHEAYLALPDSPEDLGKEDDT